MQTNRIAELYRTGRHNNVEQSKKQDKRSYMCIEFVHEFVYEEMNDIKPSDDEE